MDRFQNFSVPVGHSDPELCKENEAQVLKIPELPFNSYQSPTIALQ